jgi:hypothetical protein
VNQADSGKRKMFFPLSALKNFYVKREKEEFFISPLNIEFFPSSFYALGGRAKVMST